MSEVTQQAAAIGACVGASATLTAWCLVSLRDFVRGLFDSDQGPPEIVHRVDAPAPCTCMHCRLPMLEGEHLCSTCHLRVVDSVRVQERSKASAVR
jgi:hypothetical protein